VSEQITVPGPPDLVKWQGFSIQAERMAGAIEITTDEEDQMAIDSLSQIKTFQKSVTAAKDEALEPFKAFVNRVRNMFAPIEDSLTNAETVIKGKRKAFILERDRLRDEENRRRMEEHALKVKAEQDRAKAANVPAPIVAPPPVVMSAPVTTRGDVGSSTAKKFWNYEVTDLAALYAARPDLVKLEVKRRETLEAVKGNQTIPGLRIFEDITVTSR
jgi:hypothetical protein